MRQDQSVWFAEKTLKQNIIWSITQKFTANVKILNAKNVKKDSKENLI